MPDDLRTLWRKATQSASDQLLYYGKLGQTDSDTATQIAVTGREGWVHVRLSNRTVTQARNDAGVPLTAGMQVKMRREHGDYVIQSASMQGALVVPDPVPASGVRLHAATHQHDGTDEIATASPAANAIPKAGASGKLATGWYDVAATIHAADAKTSPVDDDELGLVDSEASSALKRLTIGNLKSYYNTLYLVLAGQSGGQTAAGGTDSGDNLTLLSTTDGTRGKILFGTHSAFDEANKRWGFGTQSPALAMHIVVPAVASTRERLARFEVDDASNAALFLFNQTSANNGFLPAVGGMSDGSTRQSLDIAGYMTSDMDTGSVPVVRFNVNITTDATDPPNGTLTAASVRPLFEFANSGTQLARIDADGVFNFKQILRALSSSGLRLEDDGGNAAMTVIDGGDVQFDHDVLLAGTIDTAVVIANNRRWYGGKTSGGTEIRIAGIAGTDVVYLGAIDNNGADTIIRERGADLITLHNGLVGINQSSPTVILHVRATAVSSTRETLAKFQVSDAGDAALMFFNQTSANGGFMPAVGGMSDGATRQSLDLAGYITAAMDSGTVPVVRFNANVTTDAADPPNGTLSAVSTRPLFEWANNGSVLMQMLANGYLGIGTSGAVSPLHIYESTPNTGVNAGVTIEQNGSGDAVLQFLLPNTQRWVIGIDNSASGNPFVISPSADLANGIWQLETNGKVSMTGGVTNSNDGLLELNLSNSQNSGIRVQNTDSDTADIWVQLRSGTSIPHWWTIGMDRSEGDALVFSASNVMSTSAPMILSRTGELTVGGGTALTTDAKLNVYTLGQSGIYSTLYSTQRYHFLGRSARNTISSPLQVINGTIIMSLGGLGYTSSGWASSTSAEIIFRAAESFTSSTRGTKIDMYVTKIGQTIKEIALELGDDRQVFAPGVYAHTTAAGATVNVDASGWLRRSTSSKRYKQDIRPLPKYEGLLDRLEPVLYKPGSGVGGGNRDYAGLVAEDVLAAGGRDFVTFGDDGQVEYVMYDRLVVLTIAEVQAMKREIAELKRRVAAL